MASNWANTLLSEQQTRANENVAQDVLREFWSCHSAMDSYRQDYYRCKKFVKGEQWSDLTTYQGMEMTEKEMLERQGRYAVVNNFLKIMLRNYKGTYIKQDLEPICKARSSEKQPIADALSTALQYVWDINSQKELLAATFEEGLKAPVFVEKVSIGSINGKYDVWSEPVDVATFIVDPNMSDPRGFDAEIVGQIHDMRLPKLLSSFAKDKKDRDRIAAIYNKCGDRRGLVNEYSRYEFGKIRDDNSFLFPEYGLCRVFEIWKKEHRDGYLCHDFADGSFYQISDDEKADIENINKQRIDGARSAGVLEEEIKTAMAIAEGKKGYENAQMPKGCRLIKPTYFYEDYWYYRFLAPDGSVISEGESPYAHKSHPYIFRFYPMMGGELQSFINDVIDLQKDINRMDAMYDWILRHSAKGALLFPRDQMDKEHGWDERKYAYAWAQPDAFIPYNPKAGYSIPQQISKNNTDIGITQMIQQKTQWIQDITGVQGTLQGKQALAGTSGTLYAQQAANATTSLLDLLNIFSSFTCELAMKQIQCMQQIYDEQKFIDICGIYGKAVKDIKGIKDTDVIVRIVESASSPSFRDTVHEELHNLFQLGIIGAKTLLKNDPMPFSYKILQDKEEEDAERVAQGGMPLPDSVPQQSTESAVAGMNNPEAGANNAYNRLAKKD